MIVVGDYIVDDAFHFAVANPSITNSLYESLSNNGLKSNWCHMDCAKAAAGME